MAFRWTHLALVVFLALFLGFPFWAYQELTKEFGIDGAANPELLCMRDLEEGRLYEGQPRCGQGPLYYGMLVGVHRVFSAQFDFGLRVSITVLAVALLSLMWMVARREQVSESLGLLLIGLYIPFIYVLSFVRVDSLMATFFLFGGFFLLFYSRLKGRSLLTGLCWGLALLTKFTAAYPIGLVGLFYFSRFFMISRYPWRFHVTDRSAFVFTVAALFGPVFAMLLMVLSLFPKFLQFSLFGHMAFLATPWPVIGWRILQWFTFTRLEDLVVLVGIVLAVYVFLKSYDLFAWVTGLGFLATFMAVYRGQENWTTYYLMPVMPFFILLVLTQLHRIAPLRRRLISIGVLLVFLGPFYSALIAEVQMAQLERTVGQPLGFLPVSGGLVLQEGDHDRLGWYLPSESAAQIVTVWEPYYDFKYAKGLENLGVVNLTLWQDPEMAAALSEVLAKIQQGAYDAILFGPNLGQSILPKLIQIAKLASPTTFPYTCFVLVPTLEERCPSCRYTVGVLLKTQAHCDQFKEALHQYYQLHFDRICQQDATVANGVVRVTLAANGIHLPQRCQTGASLLQRYVKRNLLLFWDEHPDKSQQVAESAECPGLYFEDRPVQVDRCVYEDLQQKVGGPYCALCTDTYCEIYERADLFTVRGIYSCRSDRKVPPFLHRVNPLKAYEPSGGQCYQDWDFQQQNVLPCASVDFLPSKQTGLLKAFRI